MAKLWMTQFDDGSVVLTSNKQKMDNRVEVEYNQGNPAMIQQVFLDGIAEIDKPIADDIEDPSFPYKRGEE